LPIVSRRHGCWWECLCTWLFTRIPQRSFLLTIMIVMPDDGVKPETESTEAAVADFVPSSTSSSFAGSSAGCLFYSNGARSTKLRETIARSLRWAPPAMVSDVAVVVVVDTVFVTFPCDQGPRESILAWRSPTWKVCRSLEVATRAHSGSFSANAVVPHSTHASRGCGPVSESAQTQ
jgi:hypothetical protein